MSYILKKTGPFYIFTIDRPATRNAVNYEVMDGLEKFLTAVENDSDVSFAVITATGERAFCSGGDLSEFHGLRTEKEAWPMLSRMAALLYRLSVLPVPTIALLNGTAVGGGCEIATACDYRLMTRESKAGFVQGTLSITTGWGGGTLLFERLQQKDQALKLLTEAQIIPAADLLTIGWATELFDGNPAVFLDEFTSKMRNIHPSVHRAYKKMIIAQFKNSGVRQRMIDESKRCAVLWEADAHHAAVEAFVSKKR